MFEIRGLFICIIFAVVLETISCSEGCSLQIGENPPVVIRKFGKKSLVQSNVQSQSYISMSHNESIQVFCEDHFMVSNNNYGNFKIYKRNITIECDHPDSSAPFSFSSSSSNIFYSNARLSCSSSSLQLYESNMTLTNCNDFMSYGIGTRSLPKNTISPIGICYDLDTLHIKYAKYMANRPKFNFLNSHEIVFPQIVDLDMELNNFEELFTNSFMLSQLFNQLYNKKISENPLLQSFQFGYESIVQDDDIKKQYIGYEKLFNIVWWRGLLEGNWRNFQNVFKERSQNFTYLLHSGVSGSMILPSLEKTTKSNSLNFNQDNKFVQTPAYIWTYYQTLENDVADKFVIIGHNTPFYKTDSASKFCEDMCNQIDWLKDSLFEKLHLMPVFGVVNCCRPEDVVNKLDNFPFEENKKLTANNEIFTERTLN